jgi:hypothetical protein
MAGKRGRFEPKGITAHHAYLDAVASADFKRFRADPRVKVADEQEFEAMRAHLAALHDGVEVVNSFTDAAGRVFDCVPVDQQPSLRDSGGKPAEPPSLLDITGERPKAAALAVTPPDPDETDRYGNSARCPPGFVPVRRVTLDEMARFRTLRDFFSKTAVKPLLPTAPVADTSQNHRYAYTIQNADNLGAHNFLNVWSPTIGADQIFSLAQHWYSGGSGAGHQTLEVGWQVYPGKYGHNQPVLFIYWTADNYNTTGAYNLDGPGFVQTNPAWPIGGALSPVSTDGGTQYEIEVAVYLFNGNWWLYLGGTAAANAVGYFPTSIYNGGAMANHASDFLMGGETVCTGAGTWPGMGSGAFANAGWQHAAFQRDIFYFPTGGGAQYAALTGQTPSPGCYTQSIGNVAAPWNIYFFFGGPGGGNC